VQPDLLLSHLNGQILKRWSESGERTPKHVRFLIITIEKKELLCQGNKSVQLPDFQFYLFNNILAWQ